MHHHDNEQAKTFEIGLMGPEDSRGVVELYRATYGEAYPIKEMYDPEHLLGQQDRGNLLIGHKIEALRNWLRWTTPDAKGINPPSHPLPRETVSQLLFCHPESISGTHDAEPSSASRLSPLPPL